MTAKGSVADPEPRFLFVPAAACGPGMMTICTARLRSGEPTGLGFTSQAGPTAAHGPEQAWVRLHSQLLRDLLRPTGITNVLLDPVSCCQTPPTSRTQAAAPGSVPEAGARAQSCRLIPNGAMAAHGAPGIPERAVACQQSPTGRSG